MAGKNESAASKILVQYEDGTALELEKGLVFRFEDNEDTPEVEHITAELVGMSGRDLYAVVSAAVELGVKLGMFGAENVEEDE